MEEIIKLACDNGIAIIIVVWAIFRLDKFLSHLSEKMTVYNHELKDINDSLMLIQNTLEMRQKHR